MTLQNLQKNEKFLLPNKFSMAEAFVSGADILNLSKECN